MSERMKALSSFRAGIRSKKIRIMIKLRMITSIDGVEPRNIPAKIIEKITIYNIANEAMITT